MQTFRPIAITLAAFDIPVLRTSLFLTYKSVILAQHHIALASHGFALLDALALAKIMLVAQKLHLADQFKEAPLIYPTLCKSAAFAVVLGCFKILEEAVIGLYHGRSFNQSISAIGGGTLKGILSLVALLAVLLIPFFFWIHRAAQGPR
jgi:hypothetical protein